MRALTIITAFLSHINSVYLIYCTTQSNTTNESYIFRICSIVLRETEWKYMSVMSFDLHEVGLSENFMKNFHNEVSPVVLYDLETVEPSSEATLLICGNVNKLYLFLAKPLPLWVPNVFYVILFAEFPHDYTEIFKDLWNLHHVTNVLIIQLKDLRKVVSYNQFFDLIIEENTEKFISNPISNVRKITSQKMSNMNGYPIKVSMFPTRLKAIAQPDGTYTGSDGIILQTMAKSMNFTPILSVPEDGYRYGWMLENGTFAGALGDIVYKKVDIAFNAAFLKDYHTDKIQFTTSVYFDQVCFVVPKGAKAHWKTLFLVFDQKLWICLLTSYCIAFLVWYLISIVAGERFDVVLLAMNMYGILLMIPVNRRPRFWSERIFMLTIIIFSFITASSFQGEMVKFLSYEMYERDITTIQELDESEYDIISASTNLKELIETDDNPFMLRLTSRFSWDENGDALNQIATHRNGASIGRKIDLEEKIARSFVENNRVQLHIVEECPRSYHMAYLMPKKSPYIAMFNDIIESFKESGIMNSWFIHAKPFTPLSEYHELAKQVHLAFSMEHVTLAFILLIFGLCFSYVVFLMELVVHRYRKKQN